MAKADNLRSRYGYAKELGAGVGIAGLVIGLYSIVNTPANILFGRLIDRVGYRFPLMAGLAGDATAMFLYSLTRTPLHLGLTRVFHGITGAIVGPATMSAAVAAVAGAWWDVEGAEGCGGTWRDVEEVEGDQNGAH